MLGQASVGTELNCFSHQAGPATSPPRLTSGEPAAKKPKADQRPSQCRVAKFGQSTNMPLPYAIIKRSRKAAMQDANDTQHCVDQIRLLTRAFEACLGRNLYHQTLP